MRANAGVAADSVTNRDGLLRTRISWMRSQAPLMFRQTRESLPSVLGRWAEDAKGMASVRLAAGAAGPIGGDQLRLDIRVGESAMLMVSAVAATLLLPGPHGLESISEVTISVANSGTLVWMPRLQIAAEGCRHASTTNIQLEPGARLFAREEMLLGRVGELPGALRQRMRVTLSGEAIYDQEIAVGAGTPAWSSSAVTGGRSALGSIVLVDTASGIDGAGAVAGSDEVPDTAVMQLSDFAVVVSSAAPDPIELSKRLTGTFARVSIPAPVVV